MKPARGCPLPRSAPKASQSDSTRRSSAVTEGRLPNHQVTQHKEHKGPPDAAPSGAQLVQLGAPVQDLLLRRPQPRRLPLSLVRLPRPLLRQGLYKDPTV